MQSSLIKQHFFSSPRLQPEHEQSGGVSEACPQVRDPRLRPGHPLQPAQVLRGHHQVHAGLLQHHGHDDQKQNPLRRG